VFKNLNVIFNDFEFCRPFAKEDFTAHPLKGEVVAPHCILSDPALILSIDISTVQTEEIRVRTICITQY
jgi:hypothetical protein